MRGLIALVAFLACAAPAQAAAPDVIGPILWVWSVYDSGQVLVNEIAGGHFAGARR